MTGAHQQVSRQISRHLFYDRDQVCRRILRVHASNPESSGGGAGVHRHVNERCWSATVIREQPHVDILDIVALLPNMVDFSPIFANAFSFHPWFILMKSSNGAEMPQAIKTALNIHSYRLLQTGKSEE